MVETPRARIERRAPDRPLRIAFIGQKGFPATWGGIEVHVAALATRLAARGHEVTVYSRRWYAPGSRGPAGGVRRVELPTLRTTHLDCIVHSTLASLHAALRGRYDLVHYHGIGPSLTSPLQLAGPAAVVATVHCLDYQAKKWGRLARTALRAGERLALAVPARTLAVSRAIVEFYARRGEACTYLPSGAEIRPPRPPARIVSELGLRGGDFLLSMGRFTVDKRIPQLVGSFLAADTGDLKLVVAGETDPGAAYSRRVRQAAGESDRVLFPGVVRGRLKEELLSNAFGLVSVSATEGLPLVVLEAMGAALVCLVSDIPGHREIIADGETGFIVPCADGPTLARHLERFVRLDGSVRGAIGSRAREFVADRHDWDRIVDRLEGIYGEVVAGNSRPPSRRRDPGTGYTRPATRSPAP